MKCWVPVTGVPASGYCLRTYAAGTTTNQAVFTDAACTIPAANPVVLDSNGEAIIYAVSGTLYKFALYDPTNTTLQAGWPVDNVTIYGGGTSSGGGTTTTTEWQPSGLVPSYISGTSFSFPVAAGNVTSTYSIGRVLQTTNTSGTVYSVITASSFGTFTTITVTPYLPGGTALDSGLSVVNYGILSPTAPSSPQKSLISVSVTHNTETLVTGTPLTVSSANGFSISADTGSNAFGEYSASTGTFTALRSGFYQVSATFTLITTGVTFSGLTDLSLLSYGSFSNFASRFNTEVANEAKVQSVLSLVGYLAAGQTITLQIEATFSVGTPVLNIGYLSIIGPL